MASHSSKTCPRCGGAMTSSGLDSHFNHGAKHMVSHGFQHGNPFFVVIGGAMAGAHALFPEKFTCPACGYTVRA